MLFFQISLKNNELKSPTIPFGIVGALFPTTFLEIAVICVHITMVSQYYHQGVLLSSTLKISTPNGSLSLNNNLLDEVFVTSEMIK